MGSNKTVAKLFQSGLTWTTLFKDSWDYVKTCDRCQRTKNISKMDKMPQNSIQYLEVFDVWIIDFM